MEMLQSSNYNLYKRMQCISHKVLLVRIPVSVWTVSLGRLV